MRSAPQRAGAVTLTFIETGLFTTARLFPVCLLEGRARHADGNSEETVTRRRHRDPGRGKRSEARIIYYLVGKLEAEP